MTGRQRAGSPGVSPLRGGSSARVLRTRALRTRAAAAHGIPATGRTGPRRNAPFAAPHEQDRADALAPGAPAAGRKITCAGAERRALSGLAPPASTVLRIPLRGTRLRRAVDPGASASPAGLTARARPEARPEERAANLGGGNQFAIGITAQKSG